jgi:hypothetical protein
MVKSLSAILASLFLVCGVASAADDPRWSVPADPANFHLFVLMGQSNMAGFGCAIASDPWQPGDKEPVPQILVLDGQGTSGSDKPVGAIAWRPGAHRLHLNQPTAQFGMGMDFAKAYLKTHPGVTVGLIPSAWGGAPIDALKQGTPIYRNAMERIRFASRQGTLKGALWHQGESDTVSAALANAYKGKLQKLIADLRQDTNVPALPFLIGNLAEFYGKCPDHGAPARLVQIATVRKDFEETSKELPMVAFVSTKDLTSIDKNFVHFDRQSLATLGQRYAEAYDKLTPPPKENQK